MISLASYLTGTWYVVGDRITWVISGRWWWVVGYELVRSEGEDRFVSEVLVDRRKRCGKNRVRSAVVPRSVIAVIDSAIDVYRFFTIMSVRHANLMSRSSNVIIAQSLIVDISNFGTITEAIEMSFASRTLVDSGKHLVAVENNRIWLLHFVLRLLLPTE